MAEDVVTAIRKRKHRGVQRVLIEQEAVEQRVRELAEELDAIYVDETPLLVGVLTGAITFIDANWTGLDKMKAWADKLGNQASA